MWTPPPCSWPDRTDEELEREEHGGGDEQQEEQEDENVGDREPEDDHLPGVLAEEVENRLGDQEPEQCEQLDEGCELLADRAESTR